MNRFNVLIIDDEKNIRQTLRICIEGMGGEVGEAAWPRRPSRRSVASRMTSSSSI